MIPRKQALTPRNKHHSGSHIYIANSATDLGSQISIVTLSQSINSTIEPFFICHNPKQQIATIGGGGGGGDLGHGHGHGNGGGDFRNKVWSMPGGPYCRPNHWRRSTAIAMFGVFLVCIPIAMKSAQLEQRSHHPVRPIPSQLWCKNFGTKDYNDP